MQWWSELPTMQQKVVQELLGWETPRPAADTGLGPDLRAALEAATTAAARIVPRGRRLTLAKATLDSLDCDGRFIDRTETPFAYSPAMVRGQLAHSAITLDMAGRRARPAAEVVSEAWTLFTAAGGAAASYVRGLEGVEADALRNGALQMMLEFRDVFPLLPEKVPVRAEPALAVSLHSGRISMFGRPDFLFGRVERGHRRMLLLDLKTGRRSLERNRAELRFYALLATVKYGVAPFRAATFYLDEASWDAEDISAEALHATARAVGVRAHRAALLTFDRPADGDLRLVPGPACQWCTRAATCPATGPRAVAA